MDAGVEFRMLGPVEVIVDGTRVDLGHAKRRTVFAALVLDANHVVPDEVLIGRVWGSVEPRSARNSLSAYLTRLRGVLSERGLAPATVLLSRRSGGYIAELDPALVDVHEFRRLVRLAGTRRSGIAAADVFRTALGLWRGTPLSGVDGSWAEQVRDGLCMEWLAARADAVDAEMRLGNHARLIPTLLELVEQYPLHERLVSQLMVALCRSGRGAEALVQYARASRRLADALGVDPSPGLQKLHQQVLRGDPALLATESRAPSVVRPVPAQLPHRVRGFAGRDAEMTQLDGFLASDSTGAVIVTISGTAGVGKTALAVHWGRLVAHRFPDGQLYVDLCGYHPHQQPLSPTEVLGRFLTALGVDSRELPSSVDERAGLYRSLIAGRRIMVVLDNARDAGQVRPLMPADPGNLAIVTSRSRLAGLVALDGSHSLILGGLSEAAARDLLGSFLGTARLIADTQSTTRLTRLCAHLPLALRLSAARLLRDPEQRISQLVRELTEAGPLATLSVPDDTHASIATAFDLSYRAVGGREQRLFRLLGLLPGTDWSKEVAAALLGATPEHVTRLLDSLAEAHLIEQQPCGRYRMHDLLHRYATDRVGAEEPEAERRSALARVYEWYVRTMGRASEILFPSRPSAADGSPDWAEQVLAGEQHNVRAFIDRAHHTEQWSYVWQLALSISRFVEARSNWEAWAATHRLALDAARRSGDLRAQATVLHRLGEYFLDRQESRPALRHLHRALALHRAAGDPCAEADALRAIGDVHREDGDLDQARELYQRALSMVGPGVASRVEGEILRGLGIVHRESGRMAAAAEYLERAVRVATGMGDRRWEAIVRRSLGLVYRDAGRWNEARQCFDAALVDLQAVGDQLWQAYTISSLSDILCRQGNHDEALATSERAMRISQQLHSRACEGWAELSRGMALHGKGSLRAAADTLEDCVHRFADLGDRRLRGFARYHLGLVRVDSGDLASAGSVLRGALSDFEQLGITSAATCCRAALQRLPPD